MAIPFLAYDWPSAGDYPRRSARRVAAPSSIRRVAFPDADGREECDEDSIRSRHVPHHGRCAGAAGARAGGRYETRPSAFRDVVQSAGAEAFRPRDAVPAFVLVSRIAG